MTNKEMALNNDNLIKLLVFVEKNPYFYSKEICNSCTHNSNKKCTIFGDCVYSNYDMLKLWMENEKSDVWDEILK